MVVPILTASCWFVRLKVQEVVLDSSWALAGSHLAIPLSYQTPIPIVTHAQGRHILHSGWFLAEKKLDYLSTSLPAASQVQNAKFDAMHLWYL